MKYFLQIFSFAVLFLLGKLALAAISLNFQEPVGSVYVPPNCNLGGICRGSSTNLHSGRDYMAGNLDGTSAITPALSVNFGKLQQYINYNQSIAGCASLSCNMGNVVVVEHLLSTGNKWLSLHAHLNSKSLYTTNAGSRVAKNQQIGIIGCAGSGLYSWCSGNANRHDHFELKKPNLGTMDLWPYGYMNQSEAGNLSILTAINRSFTTIPNLQANNSQVLLPFFSRSATSPSSSNYDVFGIAGLPVYGALPLKPTVQTTFTNVGIGGTVYGSSTVNDLFINPSVTLTPTSVPLTGQKKLTEGDYSFYAYSSQFGRGYDVKFSVVNEAGLIVDNDQRNADTNTTNDSGTEPAYNGSVGNKVPGYFLTADLHSGRSGAFAQWKPYKAGDYRIYAHIPEGGTTATQVRYVVKTKGNGTNLPVITSQAINQATNRNRWVRLVAANGSNIFSFNDNGYLGLSLSNTSGSVNYDAVTAAQKVAFDAVKFEPTWISRYATLNGASDWIPSSQVVSNGVLKLPVNNAPNSYFWSEHRFNLPGKFSASNFKLTARVKNPASEGGISAYDVCMSVDNTAKTVQGKGVCFMGESWAVSYTGIGGNGSWNTNRSQLVRDFSQWHTIALEGINNTLSVYYDNVRIDQVTYPGTPGQLNIFSLSSKGSISIDWMTLSINGTTVVNKNF